MKESNSTVIGLLHSDFCFGIFKMLKHPCRHVDMRIFLIGKRRGFEFSCIKDIPKIRKYSGISRNLSNPPPFCGDTVNSLWSKELWCRSTKCVYLGALFALTLATGNHTNISAQRRLCTFWCGRHATCRRQMMDITLDFVHLSSTELTKVIIASFYITPHLKICHKMIP